MPQKLSKILVFTLFGIVFSLSASAQIRGKFAIGGFGNIGSVDLTYSAPIIFESSKCLEVSNGIKTMLNSKQGNFKLDCIETRELELEILAYPVPATDFLNIRLVHTQNLTNDKAYYLNIIDASGKFLQVVKTDLTALLSGTRIPVSQLYKGNYILSLSTNTAKLQSVKFIKYSE